MEPLYIAKGLDSPGSTGGNPPKFLSFTHFADSLSFVPPSFLKSINKSSGGERIKNKNKKDRHPPLLTSYPSGPSLPFFAPQSSGTRLQLRPQSGVHSQGQSPNGAGPEAGLVTRPTADPPSGPAATTAGATHRALPAQVPPYRGQYGESVPGPRRQRGRFGCA